MLKPKLKKFVSFIMCFTLLFALISTEAYAADNVVASDDVYVFSTSDFLDSAKIAYDEGLISRDEHNFMCAHCAIILEVRGQNKIVTIDNYTVDVYINNVIWGIATFLGIGAVDVIIASAIPGLNSAMATLMGAVVGGVGFVLLDADNGVVIRIKTYDANAGYGIPDYKSYISEIREQ